LTFHDGVQVAVILDAAESLPASTIPAEHPTRRHLTDSRTSPAADGPDVVADLDEPCRPASMSIASASVSVVAPS
jgi:hypothetical protein